MEYLLDELARHLYLEGYECSFPAGEIFTVRADDGTLVEFTARKVEENKQTSLEL